MTGAVSILSIKYQNKQPCQDRRGNELTGGSTDLQFSISYFQLFSCIIIIQLHCMSYLNYSTHTRMDSPFWVPSQFSVSYVHKFCTESYLPVSRIVRRHYNLYFICRFNLTNLSFFAVLLHLHHKRLQKLEDWTSSRLFICLCKYYSIAKYYPQLFLIFLAKFSVLQPSKESAMLIPEHLHIKLHSYVSLQ